MAPARYDRIGVGYGSLRRPDDRLARAIAAALGVARSVLDVGAGTGNYEPADPWVVAAEPSRVMLDQRSRFPAVQAVAEHLPFRDGSFDAVMAVSTVHHWSDLPAGLAEMRRVAPRRVVYFGEPACHGQNWLVDDYFPEIVEMSINQAAPTAADVAEVLGGEVAIHVFEIPADFTEASAGAFWARPERYCDPDVRAGLSMFRLLDPAAVERGVARLAGDLADGTWDARNGHLRSLPTLDVGYRLVVSDG